MNSTFFNYPKNMILLNNFYQKIKIAIWALSILFLQGCKEAQKELRGEPSTVKKNEIVILTKSDDNSNPFYISKLKSFENYRNYEFITNKKKDTLRFEVDDWNMILVGTKNSLVDSLIIKNGDTLLLTLNDNKITKKFKNRCLEKWSYNGVLEDNTVKKEVDSLYNLMIRVDFDNPIEISSPNYKVKTYRLIPNKSISKDSVLPILINKYQELIKTCRAEKNYVTNDKSKEKFLDDLLERKIFSHLHVLNYYFYSSTIENFLLSDIFLSDSIDNKYNEYDYLSTLLYKGTFKSKKPSVKSKLTDLYTYDSIGYFIKDIWLEKARMVYLENIAGNINKVEVAKKRLDDFHNEYHNIAFKNYIEGEYLIDLKVYINPL